jgi:hypothetical protein
MNMTPCLLINRARNQAYAVAKWLLEKNDYCWEGTQYVYNRTQDAAPLFDVFGKTVEGTKESCEFYYPQGVES